MIGDKDEPQPLRTPVFMPHIADVVFILAMAFAVWWKFRCIRRGCRLDIRPGEEARSARRRPPGAL